MWSEVETWHVVRGMSRSDWGSRYIIDTNGTAETANQHRRMHLPRPTNGEKGRLRLPELA